MFEPENKNESEFEDDEIIENILDYIAENVVWGNITDDNLSLSNLQTSLEQILYYEFVTQSAEEICDFKKRIENKVKEYVDKAKFEKNMVEKEIRREIPLEKLLNYIAENVFLGRITDDNPSNINGLTSLDQLLYYELEFDDDKDFCDTKNSVLSRVIDLRGGSNMVGRDVY